MFSVSAWGTHSRFKVLVCVLNNKKDKVIFFVLFLSLFLNVLIMFYMDRLQLSINENDSLNYFEK